MERLLTPEEVSEKLTVPLKTVKNWLRDGRLRGVKAGKVWRIQPSALERFLGLNEAR